MNTASRFAVTSPVVSLLHQRRPRELTVARTAARTVSAPPGPASNRVPIARKVRRAERCLDASGASTVDVRRGLVRVAATQLDELLLDGVLASLGK